MAPITEYAAKLYLAWLVICLVIDVAFLVLDIKMYKGLKVNDSDYVMKNLKIQVGLFVVSIVVLLIFGALLMRWIDLIIGIVFGSVLTSIFYLVFVIVVASVLTGLFYWYVKTWCDLTKRLNGTNIELTERF